MVDGDDNVGGGNSYVVSCDDNWGVIFVDTNIIVFATADIIISNTDITNITTEGIIFATSIDSNVSIRSPLTMSFFDFVSEIQNS